MCACAAGEWRHCGRSPRGVRSIEEPKMNKQHINPKELGAPAKLVYVSGQVSGGADGKVVGAGDMRAQCKQVFENLTHVLRAAGAGWDDVIKMNGYMVGFGAENVAPYPKIPPNYPNP